MTSPIVLSFLFLQLVVAFPTEFSETNFGFNESKWYREKDFIHGSSRRYKPNDIIENPVFLLDRFSPLDDGISMEYCRRSAKCQPLNANTTCFGAKLPYSMTTTDLVPSLTSQEQIAYHFAVWKRLIHLPRCWAVIQPFLCSLYMPKCENDSVDLPSQEMCNVILGPCRILTEENAWPMSIRCHNNTEFPSRCKNDVKRLTFNTSGRCREPMVATDNPNSYYDSMETCGVQCDNPMFTPDERQQIHSLVGWAATVCFFLNLFTVLTFVIDWKCVSKYPALVIFYMNLCFMIVCAGWLAQFLPGGREDIVCRKDGTLRIGEPNARENLSCVVVFVLVYYFFMAAIVWFVIFTYAYHVTFQALGKIQERMDKKGAYFHLVAWSLPLVLTITVMALGEIDGNSVSGVCFVGSIHHEYRAVFFLLPVLAALLVGGFFLSKGLLKLIRLKIGSQEFISEKASAKLRETIVRLTFFSVVIVICGAVTFVCHIYEFRNSPSWHTSFRKYIVCRLVYSTEDAAECRMTSRPSLAILQLHLLALFATGIAMSTWVWRPSTVHAWKRFLARMAKKEPMIVPPKPKKHQIIASTYAKREKLNCSVGHVSVSIQGSYPDPVGLEFELNSGDTGSISPTWAAALPKLVTRRDALIGTQTNSNSSQRRNSMDSEISYSVRRVSVESRRHSLDSAVSVQVAEVTKTVRKHRKRRTRNNRRASSTSQDSQLDAQILTVLAGGKMEIPVKSIVHNKNRRQAMTGFDVLTEKLFGNLGGPLDLSGSSEGSSEEEEEITQVRETLITGRVLTNTNSGYSEEDKVAAEEEDEECVNSDDVTQPFLALNYKNKRDPNTRLSIIGSKSNRKSGNESDNEYKVSKKKEINGRHSKASNQSDNSRTSKKIYDSIDTEKRNNKTERLDKFTYPSCSDLENCTDDAKWIQSEGEGKGSCKRINVGVSTDCSLCPDNMHVTHQSGTSAISVGSNPSYGREIGTQTNVSFNNKERSSSAGSKPKRKKSNASRQKPCSTESSLK